MSKKDFNKGMEAGAKPFEEKFENLSKETNKIGEKLNEKLDSLGDVMDIVLDDLSDIQKKELYNLNTPYDLKEDLDDDEKEILSALLIKLSENTKNNEYQRKFIRSVNNYIGITTPQTGLDISCIENIENINSQKIILQAVMEYMYLESYNFDFLNVYEEIFEHFSVNRKGIREIKEHIEAIYRATGEEGIAEKYSFVPEETREEIIDEETLKLYKEATPYDLLVDLSENENKILCNLLDMMVEKEGKNEYQSALLDILEEEGELGLDNISENNINFDDIQNLEVQKIMLQVLMEYGFLGSNEFVFMEDEIFDDFSVNKREIRQIKERIEKVYNEKGYEGIIEKYQYMGIKDDEKEEKSQFLEYDGSDISEACADQVNIHHHYINLIDYLVYFDEECIDEKRKLYRVHKQTGEKVEICMNEVEDKSSIKACNFCGYDSSLFLVHKSGIYSIDVNLLHIKRITNVIVDYQNDYFPQCNEKYLVYISEKKVKEDRKKMLICIDLQNLNYKEILPKELKYGIPQFKLVKDLLYFCENYYDRHILYKYHILTDNNEKILDLPLDSYEFLEDNSYHNSTVGQYGKLLICARQSENNCLEPEGSYDCLNLEDDAFTTVLLPESYGAACFVGYNYIYYLKKDSSIRRYNILTGQMELIIDSTKAITFYEEGFIRKKTYRLIGRDRIHLQIVGKWLYYEEANSIFDVTVYKISLDDKEKKNIVLNI